jgi:hypothetical protein
MYLSILRIFDHLNRNDFAVRSDDAPRDGNHGAAGRASHACAAVTVKRT